MISDRFSTKTAVSGRDSYLCMQRCFIQQHMVVISIWCALFVTSQFDVTVIFPNQRFGEVC